MSNLEPAAAPIPANTSTPYRNPYMLVGAIVIVLLIVLFLYFRNSIPLMSSSKSKTDLSDTTTADATRKEIDDLISSINTQQEKNAATATASE